MTQSTESVTRKCARVIAPVRVRLRLTATIQSESACARGEKCSSSPLFPRHSAGSARKRAAFTIFALHQKAKTNNPKSLPPQLPMLIDIFVLRAVSRQARQTMPGRLKRLLLMEAQCATSLRRETTQLRASTTNRPKYAKRCRRCHTPDRQRRQRCPAALTTLPGSDDNR